MEIIFNETFPPLLKPATWRVIKSFRWILPAWLQRLYVRFDTNETDAAAYITVEKDYRFASLYICAGWASGDSYLRREYILHELIHLHNAPSKNYCLDVLREICDGALFQIAKKEIVAKNEAATSDLAYAILKQIDAGK